MKVDTKSPANFGSLALELLSPLELLSLAREQTNRAETILRNEGHRASIPIGELEMAGMLARFQLAILELSADMRSAIRRAGKKALRTQGKRASRSAH